MPHGSSHETKQTERCKEGGREGGREVGREVTREDTARTRTAFFTLHFNSEAMRFMISSSSSMPWLWYCRFRRFT
jgi:hypothetical protein